jgi:hypothetical protein
VQRESDHQADDAAYQDFNGKSVQQQPPVFDGVWQWMTVIF